MKGPHRRKIFILVGHEFTSAENNTTRTAVPPPRPPTPKLVPARPATDAGSFSDFSANGRRRVGTTPPRLPPARRFVPFFPCVPVCARGDARRGATRGLFPPPVPPAVPSTAAAARKKYESNLIPPRFLFKQTANRWRTWQLLKNLSRKIIPH
ncbi:hypothetical protein GWI33_006289 [Rhynchophorus ferrugineus]|uniref:Uncharacterized protein n=1 Tax=Rhynchophorus ferrugineus TaxID=354439 RepID=A0A834MJ27_RHYFE|nr:hypothetical protein GWI33_006289 [Rhynchophorus ferrugineus]